MITKNHRDEIDTLIVENPHATAEVSLYGAHVLSFKPKKDNRERLWVSPKSKLDKTKPIRGGIPICWPWFGAASDSMQSKRKDLPSHGYARTQDCKLGSHTENEDSSTTLVFKLTSHGFPELGMKLDLNIEITVGESLEIALVTQNCGDDTIEYFAALHTYFAVEDIRSVKIENLKSDYLDKLQNYKLFGAPIPYKLIGETDRVHLGNSTPIEIVSESFKTTVNSKGNDSIVVWNPWQDKSVAMDDMSDNGYRNMLCVETARTQTGQLLPGEHHKLSQTIT
jgi:glucose-6-phosphate 1-epimerase